MISVLPPSREGGPAGEDSKMNLYLVKHLRQIAIATVEYVGCDRLIYCRTELWDEVSDVEKKCDKLTFDIKIN